MTDEWQQDKLFDRWDLTEIWEPVEFVWPEEMKDFTTTDKERWGVLTIKRAIFEAMDGARVIHRGDAICWEESGDASIPIYGDLDVAWRGRSPIIESKCHAPGINVHKDRKLMPPMQGLDWQRRQEYLNEQTRSGRPFYVVWTWPDVITKTRVVLGKRIDMLSWPPDAVSAKRNMPGKEVAWWVIDNLWTIYDIADDVASWSGSPYQETMLV